MEGMQPDAGGRAGRRVLAASQPAGEVVARVSIAVPAEDVGDAAEPERPPGAAGDQSGEEALAAEAYRESEEPEGSELSVAEGSAGPEDATSPGPDDDTVAEADDATGAEAEDATGAEPEDATGAEGQDTTSPGPDDDTDAPAEAPVATTDPEPAVAAELALEPAATAEPEPDPEPAATADPEPAATAEPEPEPEPAATAEPEPLAEAEAEREPEPVATAEPEPAAAADPEPAAADLEPAAAADLEPAATADDPDPDDPFGDDYESLVRLAERTFDAVDRALARLGDGTYGTCEACGGPIGDDILEADPTASTCERHLRPA